MKSHSSAAFDGKAVNGLFSVEEVSDLIRAGVPLSLAGRREALDRLPAGNWIAGTSPYFMAAEGGRIVGDDLVFATDLSPAGEITFACYGEDELERISGDAPDNGFALTVIPSGSACHTRFANEAANYPDAFLKPAVGWIAGVDLDETGAEALVYDGRTAQSHANCAVVAHVALPEGHMVNVEIVNLFSRDDNATISFEEIGFSPEWCIVEGERKSFYDLVIQRGREDGLLPLVGDFAGARLNASIRAVHHSARRVDLYAPVFPGVDYAFAQPVEDYAAAFRNALDGRDTEGMVWACNCILNFLFGRLNGERIGDIAGPVTFGEIAYQLLNQTLVIVRVL